MMIKTKKNRKWLILLILSASIIFFLFYYRFENKNSFTFNMKFDETRIPYIYSSLESQKGYFLVDLGACYNCSLNHNNITFLKDAKPIGERKFINLNSQVFSCPEYLLDDTIFLNINIQDLIVTENTTQTDLFQIKNLKTKHDWKPSQFLDPSKIIGSLGNRLLKHVNFVLDFKKHILTIYPQNITPLITFPYKNLLNFKKIPYEFVQDLGFVCTVSIQGENKRFILDTGSSISIIKTSSLPSNQSKTTVLKDVSIKIKGQKFKLNTLHILDSFQLSNLDGLIGMDFFHDKRLFFDTSSNQLLIQEF